MKVLVTVKEVTEVDDEFEIEDHQIPDRYVDYTLNEWDDYAVEEAVQIKEARPDDAEVVSVTIGPERVEETIRMALAKGVDRGIRIWDSELDRDLLDIRTKAELFAAVVEAEVPDVVLTGVQAGDDAFGATGVALASAVDFGWAAVVTGLTLNEEAGVAEVRRELEGGVEELVEIALPAVFTIQTGINEPRYASLRGIRAAQSKEIVHQSLADLGVDSSSIMPGLQLTEMYIPETESETKHFEGSPTEQAAQLATVLRDLGVGAE